MNENKELIEKLQTSISTQDQITCAKAATVILALEEEVEHLREIAKRQSAMITQLDQSRHNMAQEFKRELARAYETPQPANDTGESKSNIVIATRMPVKPH